MERSSVLLVSDPYHLHRARGMARELGLDYACLAIVANWAAGAGPDVDEVITLQDVLDNVAAAMDGVPPILQALLAG